MKRCDQHENIYVLNYYTFSETACVDFPTCVYIGRQSVYLFNAAQCDTSAPCVIMTQQNATFRGVGPWSRAFDPQIRFRARFLYSAPSRQVRSIILCLIVRKLDRIDRQLPLKTSTSLHYTTPAGKIYLCDLFLTI